MSTHGPSWYKVFATGIALTYFFFILMVSQCTFSLSDPLSLFNTFLCVLYVGFTLLCFIIGIPICLVGIAKEKKENKTYGFYVFLIIYFLAGLLGVVIYRFI